MTPEPAAAEAVDAPIAGFSQCHVGILAQLQSFARLPELLAPAAEARRIADQTVSFFQHAVQEHHAEEERELFPAVLASAVRGEERQRVQALVERLVAEHRQVEAAFRRIEGPMKAISRGLAAELDAATVAEIVARYEAHARFEESDFLPLAQQILGRNDNHMAALGLSLHLRHSVPEALRRYAARI